MEKHSIFIVEDDETIVSLLKNHLKEHYDVYQVTNFRAVKQELEAVNPDLILMDITLPYFNGFYWTTEIRKQSTVPIIFISSSDDEMNMVMALDMGGDDYLAKPFSLGLLEAKISALLRRSKHFSSDELSFMGFELSREGVLLKGQEQIHLSPTESKMLALLLSHSGQVVSKEAILEKLWESEDFINQNTLNVNMTRLRKKVQEIGFDYIHTIRGVGYVIK
ncbi:response regulator transcription factor [Streptococcus plurextorum]|uniref:response regulator transcription factor n=1 Tax=Streptococcus plurextorum TaxID=456876 RepID=UPI00041ADE2E|nr:response regulator transcription factor [Streptococcus plurextorum]